jgi:hypothetical protein
MAINNYSVICATQRDVQETVKTNFVVSQKATTPCAGNDQFAIFTLTRNLLGNATNKSFRKWTIPPFKTPTAMSPQQATVHTEFSKGTFPFLSSLTITGKGGSVLHMRVAPLVLYNVYNVPLICKGIYILLYDSLWRDKNLSGTSTE